LSGFDFGYGFDSIGNRTYAMTNGRYDEYQADALNRYVARDVLGVVDVRGRANASAAVLVNDLPASRSADGGFYAAVVVENGAAPVAPAIKVQATNGGNAPLVATEPRSAFLPQTPESYDYDLDGNLTRDGRWTYTWDGENRLVGLETRTDVAAALPGLTRQKLTFAYDARGRRILKRVFNWNTSTSTYILNSETKFLYDGWNLLAEYNGMNANALVRSYVWGPDLSGSLQGAGGVGGLLWATVAPGSTNPAPGNYAPAYDGNGNIVAWIDLADSSVGGKRDYGAFGEPVLATGPAASLPFAFSTKYRDAETELYYYGFRYYNPSTGRWPSRDPIGENGGSNLYEMTGNNPINKIDYLGLAFKEDDDGTYFYGPNPKGPGAYTHVYPCNYLIFVGHNDEVPQDKLVTGGCSAASVYGCDGAVSTAAHPATPTKWIPGSPPATAPEKVISALNALSKASKAVWAAKAAIESACLSKKVCCKVFTIKVDCRNGASGKLCGNVHKYDCNTRTWSGDTMMPAFDGYRGFGTGEDTGLPGHGR